MPSINTNVAAIKAFPHAKEGPMERYSSFGLQTLAFTLAVNYVCSGVHYLVTSSIVFADKTTCASSIESILSLLTL